MRDEAARLRERGAAGGGAKAERTGDWTMKIPAICGIAVLPILLVLLAGCASQRSAEDVAAANANANCLRREVQAVAPQPVDLETATLAVMARCDFPGVIERPLIAKYPGYRDYIHEAARKRYAEIMDATRQDIALARASR